MPALLRDLSGTSDTKSRRALWELQETIWHQGDVYEATAYAVPTLIEIAAAPGTRRRHEILGLLTEISQSNGLRGGGRGAGRRWSLASRRAVAKGVGAFVKLLEDSDARVRAAAAGLLAGLPEVRTRTLTPLRAASRRERDPSALAAAAYALGCLKDPTASTRDLLSRLARDSKSELVRLFAAIGLARMLRRKTPESAREVLERASDERDRTERLFAKMPWDVGAREDPDEVLRSVTARGKEAVTGRLLKRLETRPTEFAAADAVNDLIFGNFKPTRTSRRWTVSELTGSQRQILAAIANRKVWRNSLLFSATLSMFGFPNSFQELRRFLSRGQPKT